MSSLSAVGRSAAARKNDRVSLCSFTFSDGRRCRAPRLRNHPHFCPDHAQKEARARTAESLGKDLAYFFSADYLSACDLTAALSRLLPAVVRGEVKPRTARTVAYLAQTLLQAIRLAQHEYTNAFGSEAWRQRVRNSVNSNHDYLFPPAPESQQPQSSTPTATIGANSPAAAQPTQAQPPASPPPQPLAAPRVNCHSERSEESAFSKCSAPQPAPALHTALPSTSAEFVQHVVAGVKTGQNSSRPLRASRRSSPEPGSATLNSAAHTASSSPVCHPERSEGSHQNHAAPATNQTHPTPGTQPPLSVPPAAPPNNPPPIRPSTSPREPNRDAPWLHFGDSRHIPPDSKLL